MQAFISENIPVRTVETLIGKAKQLGLRVVHRPEAKSTNVVQLHPAARHNTQTHPSPEAA